MDGFQAYKIQHQSMAEKVSGQLIDWIMEGRLLMGQKLNTEELAQMLGVSRMPVREAIKELEKMGLVKSEPYVGARLVTMNMEDIRQIYMMRCVLEPIAAYHACRNATDDEIDGVLHIHRRFERLVREGDPTAQEIFVQNRAFHFSIYQSSRLDRIFEVIKMLWSNLAFGKLIYGQTYAQSKDAALRMLEEHFEYYRLLRARDAETFQNRINVNLTRIVNQMPDKLARYLHEEDPAPASAEDQVKRLLM